jgi:hypothetical protein
MYGSKTTFGLASTTISAASMWIGDATIALATVSIFLLIRVFITMRSGNTNGRP